MKNKDADGTVSSGINHWPEDERPREKLFRHGEHTLSDAELLAILLRSGTKGRSALDVARKIKQRFKTFRAMSHTDLLSWREFKGLGAAKIAQIKAALEIGRRFGDEKREENGPAIKSSADAAELLMLRLRDLKKEVFKVLLLDARNRVIEIVEIEEGTVDQAHPVIREIFQKALQYFAVSLICVHNHPSGDPAPSREDREFTERLLKAAEALRLRVLDHIIIGDNRYYSFADSGFLPRHG